MRVGACDQEQEEEIGGARSPVWVAAVCQVSSAFCVIMSREMSHFIKWSKLIYAVFKTEPCMWCCAFTRCVSYAVQHMEGVLNFIIKLWSIVNSASCSLEPVHVSVLYLMLCRGCSSVDLFFWSYWVIVKMITWWRTT